MAHKLSGHEVRSKFASLATSQFSQLLTERKINPKIQVH